MDSTTYKLDFPADPEKALLEQRPQHESFITQPIHLGYEERPKRRGRFLKAFVVGVLLFFGLNALWGDVASFVTTRIRGACGRERHDIDAHWEDKHNEVLSPGHFPIPPDLTVDHCAEWQDWDDPEEFHYMEEPEDMEDEESDEMDEFDDTDWFDDMDEFDGTDGLDDMDDMEKDNTEDLEDMEEFDEFDPDHHRYSQWNTFELPISSDFLFLLSRGPWSAGRVEIGQSNEPGDVVLVNVTTYYRRPHFLEQVQVCQLNRKENEFGVGVFSTNPPHRRRPDHHHRLPVWFRVNVTLPSGTKESPLTLKSFATSMGIFPHSVGDLADTVRFGSLELKSAVSPISVKSIIAEDAVVKTSAGSIEGTFATSSSLKLSTANGLIKANTLSLGETKVETSNGAIIGNFSTKGRLELSTANAPILVNVTLVNTDEDTPTEVKMDTAHGAINGNLTLYSVNSDSTSPTSNPGGSFKISARNAVGPITLLTPQAPINSTVHLEAGTALGSINVQMHPTFEGRFSVKNTLGKINVGLDDENKEDPDERGRKRVLNFGKVGDSTTGKVYWGEESGLRGEVKLDTTLADVSLRL